MTFFNNRLADIFRGGLRPSSCLSEWIKRQPDIKFFVKDPYRESEFGADKGRTSKLVMWSDLSKGHYNQFTIYSFNGGWNLQPTFFQFRKRLALWLMMKAYGKELRDE